MSEQAAPKSFDSEDTPPSTTGRLSRIPWHHVGLIAGLGLFAVAAVFLFHTLEEVSWLELKESTDALSWTTLACAFLFAAGSYTALCGYDFIAARHVGIDTVGPRRIALTAFVAHTFSFMLGYGVVSGGAVRLRLYGEAGIESPRIVAMGIIGALAFWTGLLALGALSLILAPALATNIDRLPAWMNAGLGIALLFALGGAVVWASRTRREIGVGEWKMVVPGWRTASAAILVGAIDTACAAAALYVLIPHPMPGGYPVFLSVFALATAAGVLSHVPGGLGVFEAVIVSALPMEPTAEIVGALLVFRVVYYVLPFIAAVGLLGLGQIRTHQTAIGRAGGATLDALRPLAPRILALLVFLGGIVLLISGALPAETDRLRTVRHFVPLPFVETSHMLGSVVGFVLLVVASGLNTRLATAWRVATGLLVAGAIFSLIKGFDYEEAIICLTVAAILYAARGEFYRRSSLFESAPPLDWIVAALVAIGASIWLGFFAYRNVDYDNQLWWSFAYHGDAPRFLRATLAVSVVAVAIAVYRLVHRPPIRVMPDGADQIERIAPIVAASPRTDSHLAFLGDKSFIIDDAGAGFVMYGSEGRTIVAMGDPVSNDPAVVRELVWRFAERADRDYASAVFYQVTTEYLPIYLDAGFSLLKIGEEAWVDLQAFTLEGAAGRKLRQTRSRCERDGLTVSIVPAQDIEAIMPELRAVSDAWLEGKRQEKGFSLGFWSETYLRRYDCIVVHHQDRIVAFANIWRAAGKNEFSVDLMRHRPDAPSGCMDALFIALMERAKAEGYRWFNLGMTPLSGQPIHRLAPAWARIANFIYRRGDRFYNFEGLRSFKEKFRPQWRPRYFAYRGSATLPQILLDVTRLISASAQRSLANDVTGPRKP